MAGIASSSATACFSCRPKHSGPSYRRSRALLSSGTPPMRKSISLGHEFQAISRATSVRCSCKKNMSFAEQILDYIEGGPKLRKWYGAGKKSPKDSGDAEVEDVDSEVVPRDAVLVMDGDSEMGQMVILSLILKRVQIKAIVKNKQAAMDSFGSYVQAVVGDSRDTSSLAKALKGVRAIICPLHVGFLSGIKNSKGLEHVVLLSQLDVYRGSSGIASFMNSKAKSAAENDEEVVKTSGIPYTIIRAGLLQDVPGGSLGFNFLKGCAAQGKLSKEDAAAICVEALGFIPQDGLVFEVVNGDQKVSDWKQLLASMNRT